MMFWLYKYIDKLNSIIDQFCWLKMLTKNDDLGDIVKILLDHKIMLQQIIRGEFN